MRKLRYLADDYEQAQTLRIQTGERIRAILQERDATWSVDEENRWMIGRDAAEVLKLIASGETEGPVPLLGRTYHRYYQQERDSYREMMRAVKDHPTWPWLAKVKGIGPTLACKMLARLDIEKADTPSAFWSYCGLGTVPGQEYHCTSCGLTMGFPVGYNVTGEHQKYGAKANCDGQLRPVPARGPESGYRVAQPKPRRGERAAYDKTMKKVMYLVGMSFLKSRGPYADVYHRAKARLERERPGWRDGRLHYTALRVTEKLFLSHLWQVWREALGQETPSPYAMAHLGHDGFVDAWEMVEGGRS